MMSMKRKLKRGVALLLTVALVTGLMPIMSEKPKEVQASTSGSKPSVTTFATKEELMTKFSPNSEGVAEAVGTLAFGKDYNGNPMKWYILGKDNGLANENNLVIFATSSISAEQKFNASTSTKLFNYNYGVYETTPTEVSSNHYGASDIRAFLQGLVDNNNTTYFTSAEKNLMQSTTVITYDMKNSTNSAKNNITYTTTDKLYLLAAGGISSSYRYYIIAGSNRDIKLTMSTYWATGNRFWVRSPVMVNGGHTSGLSARSGYYINTNPVKNEAELRPASNLNLSSVIFSSAATAASSGSVVAETIPSGTAMTLRLDGSDKAIGIVNYYASSEKLVATKDASATGTVALVVQGNDGTNDWYYSKVIDGSIPTTVTMDEIATALGISEVAYGDCKVWIETTGDDGLIYAMDDVKLGVESVEISNVSTPVPEQALDVSATATATGITSESETPIVTWKVNGAGVSGDAVYNTSYTASVTIAPDSGYAFMEDVPVTFNGEAVDATLNTDGSITVSYTFDTTAKRKFINVTAPTLPAGNTFTNYYTSLDVLADGGNRELGSTATVTFEGNTTPVTDAMDVEWTIANANGSGYDKTPGVVNTFKWTIKPSEYQAYNDYDTNGQVFTGTVDIKNKAYTDVTHTGIDNDSLVYDGNTIDLSVFFDIDNNAGDRTYTIESSSTGEGTISGSILTVTKTGTFVIKLATAPNDIYGPSEATATLVVADGVITSVASGYSSTYDGEAHGITVTVSNPADTKITYSTDGRNYSETNPTYTNVGTYTVYYKIEKDNYVTVSGEQTVTIVPLDVTLKADDQTIQWGTSIDGTPNSLLVPDGLLAAGDVVEAVVLTPSTSELTEDGVITACDAVIKNANGDDVTANYNVSYLTGKLIITHNTGLQPVRLEVTKTKVDYFLKETLDVTDLVVTVFYDDGYSKVLNALDYSTNASYIDMTQVGTKILTVTYTENGGEVTFDVNISVTHNDTLEPVRIEASKTVTDYYSEKELKEDDLTVTVFYDDGYSRVLGVQEYSTTKRDVDMMHIGTKTLTIIYTENGATVIDDVTINVTHNSDIPPSYIEVTKADVEYLSEERLDETDLRVEAFYRDGYSVVLDEEDYETTASDIDMSQIGTKTLTVTYIENNETVTDDVVINVTHNPAIPPSYIEVTKADVDYLSEERLDETDLRVEAFYRDGYSVVLDEEDYTTTASDIDMSQIGTKTLTVKFTENNETVTDDVEISVTHNPAIPPQSIEAVKTDVDYLSETDLDLSDLVVEVFYRDGYSEILDATSYKTNESDIDMSKIGSKTLTVTYTENNKSVTDDIAIEVTHNPALKATSIEAVKNTTVYKTGDTLSMDDFVVTAYYSDGYDEEFTSYSTNASNIDMSTVGTKTLIAYIVYRGQLYEREIEILVSHNTTFEPSRIEASKTDTDYISGDTLDVSDLTVVVFYDDGYSKEVTDYTTNVADIDMSQIGRKPLTVTYTENGRTVTDDVVIVVERNTSLAPERIEVSDVDYTAGDDINLDELTVTAFYADGYSKVVTDITSNADELDMSTVGKKVLTIFYTENGQTVSEDIVLTVEHNETSKPVKLEGTKADTEYTAGDALDVSDVVVKVQYEDGHVKVLSATGTEAYKTNASDIDMATVGEKTLTVTYTENGATVTADIVITVSHNETLTMTDVEVTKTKTEYIAGEELNLDDIIVKAFFSDGYETLLTTYSTNAASLDMTQIGEKVLKVTAVDKGVNITKEILITVKHDETLPPSKIEVSGSYEDKEYKAGDELSEDDFKVTADYEDGYSSEVTDFTTNIDEIDMSTVGDKTVVIKYTENGETVTKEVVITVVHNETVKPVRLEATKTDKEYASGESLDLSDLVVKVEYEDGFIKVLSATGTEAYKTNASDIDMSKIGEKTLTVTYTENGATVTADITIVVSHNEMVTMTDVEVTKTKTEYIAGEELKLDDIIVKAFFSDGYETLLTTYSTNATSLDMTQIGEKILKITASDKGVSITKEILITVKHDETLPPSKIEVSGPYEDKEYKAGDVLDKDDFNVTGEYKDGYSKDVSDFTTNIDEIDMSTVGDKTVVITYTENGETVTKEVVITVVHDDTLPPTKIEVSGPYEDKEYKSGDELSEDDFKVTADYEDGYSSEVSDFTTNIDEIDMSKIGDKKVVITYTENGETVTKEVVITVAHNELLAIKDVEVTKPKTEYVAGEELKLDDMIVKAFYEDGYEAIITAYLTNADSIDMTQVGEKILKITVDSNARSRMMIVKEILITVVHNDTLPPTKIEVSGPYEDKEYKSGDELSEDDFKVTSDYEDGYSEEVSEFTTNIDEIDMSTVGEKTVVITYTENGETVTKEVIITVRHGDNIPPANIEVEGVKDSYVAGDKLDADDLVVKAFFEDGFEMDVRNFKTNLDEIDMTQIGDKKLVVSYTLGDTTVIKEFTFTVTHDETLAPSKIEAVKSEVKYLTGDTIRLDDIEVTVFYADGYSEKVTAYVTNAADIDMTTAGDKTLTVSYTANGETAEVDITIHVDENPKTGDSADADMNMWLLLLITCGITAVGFYRKKRYVVED